MYHTTSCLLALWKFTLVAVQWKILFISFVPSRFSYIWFYTCFASCIYSPNNTVNLCLIKFSKRKKKRKEELVSDQSRKSVCSLCHSLAFIIFSTCNCMSHGITPIACLVLKTLVKWSLFVLFHQQLSDSFCGYLHLASSLISRKFDGRETNTWHRFLLSKPQSLHTTSKPLYTWTINFSQSVLHIVLLKEENKYFHIAFSFVLAVC